MGYFTWENIPGWRWRMRTSKSKYRAPADFTLSNYGLLFPLLEAVPHEQRTGAIVKGEHVFPVQERSYRKWFPRLATIPGEVWSMEARAGAATEAEEAGVDKRLIQEAMTYNDARSNARYIRRRSKTCGAGAQQEPPGRLRTALEPHVRIRSESLWESRYKTGCYLVGAAGFEPQPCC
ncbi:MAG TPA: hypothetical protein VFL53_20375 [Pseudolabrys sp.]|nr:hypothetical protein [Pseudolabrys sp.]